MRTNLVGGHEVEVQDAPLAHGGVHKHEGVLIQVHGRQQLLALLALRRALAGRLNLVHHQLRKIVQDAHRARTKLARLLGRDAPTRMWGTM